MHSRGIAVLAALAVLVSGIVAGAGSAGTNAISGGSIVFSGVDPKDGTSDIYVVKSDGSAKTNITNDDASGKDLYPEWSRDGSRAVFVRDFTVGGSRLFVVNANGSGLSDITPEKFINEDIVEPSWSPDGTQIVFASARDGNYDLYTLHIDSKVVSRLTSTTWPVQNLDPTWSPTGKAIAFSRSGLSLTSPAAGLFEVRLDSTRGAVRLTKTSGRDGDVSPDYSPDGRQIAFSSDRNGYDDVYVLDLASFALTNLTVSKHSDVEPSFAPDGTAIVFVSDRTGATELWAQSLISMSPGLGGAVQLTSDGQPKSHPSWGVASASPQETDPPVAGTAAPPAA